LPRAGKLDSEFIYERVIDRATYHLQCEKLAEETAAIDLELYSVSEDDLDVERVLDFAQRVLADPATTWCGLAHHEKQRFQDALFPSGLTFDGRDFGTPINPSIFSCLREISGQNVRMASRT
jgi:hypothetical protein